ncbi:hypothetical protein B0H13DRAFT_2558597 [Mycena leptocephala]|nr:hypothetical protein B0H13DRAFT_2558597 [Mycena leptocephala]
MASNSSLFDSQLVGPVVLAIELQAVLSGIICAMTWRYFRCFGNSDRRFYRYLVGAIFLLNVFELGMYMDILYRAGTWFENGELNYFARQTWTMCAEPAVTTIIVFFAQLFFVERCAGFTKSRWALVFLVPLLLLSIGSGLAYSISLFKLEEFAALWTISVRPLVGLWLVSLLVLDGTILTILVSTLKRSHGDPWEINRLCRRALDTFLLTTLPAWCTLLFFFAQPGSTYYLIPQFSIGRFHTLAVIMLLCRDDPNSPVHDVARADLVSVTHMHDLSTDTVTVTVETFVECDIPMGSDQVDVHPQSAV